MNLKILKTIIIHHLFVFSDSFFPLSWQRLSRYIVSLSRCRSIAQHFCHSLNKGFVILYLSPSHSDLWMSMKYLQYSMANIRNQGINIKPIIIKKSPIISGMTVQGLHTSESKLKNIYIILLDYLLIVLYCRGQRDWDRIVYECLCVCLYVCVMEKKRKGKESKGAEKIFEKGKEERRGRKNKEDCREDQETKEEEEKGCELTKERRCCRLK